MDSGVIEELSMKISSRLNPPKPKVGMHPLVIKKRVKMESIRSNYKKDSEIQEEVKNVNIKCYLMFDYKGKYEFKTSEYCTGLLLGHFQTKCPKLEYDENGIKRFVDHLQNIGGFDEALKRREKSYWEKRAEWSKSKEASETAIATEGIT